MEEIRGYKVFNSDWTCSPNGNTKQYACPGKYEEDITPIRCGRGMHFCRKAADCFNYYTFDSNNKVAEVIAYGDIAEEGNKCCTNKLEIVRELTWHEVLELVNTGKDCTGLCNSGNRNSGDWNKSSFVAGCFNTENHSLLFFDKPTTMTYEQWRRSDACYLMNQIDFRPTEWIWSDDMTDDEKDNNPDWEINGGYLKVRDNANCCLDWWNGLSDRQKDIIKAIPNFDADKFFAITGIDLRLSLIHI